MGTYKEIQDYVKVKYGFVPATCWIAHAKQKCGILIDQAPNRNDHNVRSKPCPDDKFLALKDALIHFGFIEDDKIK